MKFSNVTALIFFTNTLLSLLIIFHSLGKEKFLDKPPLRPFLPFRLTKCALFETSRLLRVVFIMAPPLQTQTGSLVEKQHQTVHIQTMTTCLTLEKSGTLKLNSLQVDSSTDCHNTISVLSRDLRYHFFRYRYDTDTTCS